MRVLAGDAARQVAHHPGDARVLPGWRRRVATHLARRLDRRSRQLQRDFLEPVGLLHRRLGTRRHPRKARSGGSRCGSNATPGPQRRAPASRTAPARSGTTGSGRPRRGGVSTRSPGRRCPGTATRATAATPRARCGRRTSRPARARWRPRRDAPRRPYRAARRCTRNRRRASLLPPPGSCPLTAPAAPATAFCASAAASGSKRDVPISAAIALWTARCHGPTPSNHLAGVKS